MPPEHTEYVGAPKESKTSSQETELTLDKALVNPNKLGPPDLPGSHKSSELSLPRRPRPGVSKEASGKPSCPASIPVFWNSHSCPQSLPLMSPARASAKGPSGLGWEGEGFPGGYKAETWPRPPRWHPALFWGRPRGSPRLGEGSWWGSSRQAAPWPDRWWTKGADKGGEGPRAHPPHRAGTTASGHPHTGGRALPWVLACLPETQFLHWSVTPKCQVPFYRWGNCVEEMLVGIYTKAGCFQGQYSRSASQDSIPTINIELLASCMTSDLGQKNKTLKIPQAVLSEARKYQNSPWGQMNQATKFLD